MTWALKFPVAPPNLAENGIFKNWLIWISNLLLNTSTSFPNLVGLAGCPWVLASKGIFFQLFESSLSFKINLFNRGKYSSLIASLRESGIAVLLISWEVRPKWINSEYFSRFFRPPKIFRFCLKDC